MPIVTEIEVSVRQKKLMYEGLKHDLELCSDDEDLDKWNEEYEAKIKIITENGQDEYWNEVINEKIETKKQLINLKEQLKCQ
jgi:hypothetical protein